MKDFNKAVKEWLIQCPAIRADKMYFNFLSAGDENQSFQMIDHSTVTEDIVGNEIGKYTFSIIDFRSLSKMPFKFTARDLEKAAEVEQINKWIKEQSKLRNLPIFDDCTIDRITVPPSPAFAGQDNSEGMHLAKYMIQVVIDYTKYT